MNVLIIHQHFRLPQEGGAIRSYYLARALTDRGIRVEVVTASPSKKKSVEVENGLTVHYVPVPYDNRFGFWKRAWAFFKFMWQAGAIGARLPGLDVCYAISVPLTTGVTGMWLNRSGKLPYIFEVGDLWPDAPIALGFVKGPILKWALLSLERVIYKRAAAIVALSDPIKSAIELKAPGKSVFVIPNMSDVEFYGTPEDGSVFRQRHQLGDKFVVSYIGAVGFANGLDFLIECARSAQQHALHMHFLICGDGALVDQHKANAKGLGLTNLSFIPFTDRKGVKAIMDATDAVFVCYKPFQILETGSPNKYFDGLAAGKLILLNFGGWIKEEVENEQCGIYIDRQRPDQFASRVRAVVEDRNTLKSYQAAAAALAHRKYSRKLLGAKFSSLIQEIVSGNTHALSQPMSHPHTH